MKVNKLVVSKGRTVENPSGEWRKSEFTLEIELADNDNVEEIKNYAEMLLEAWLS